MALTPCPQCEHPISDLARFCPSCGAHFKDVKVTIVGVDIDFWALAGLWVKVTAASIPLALVTGAIWWAILDIVFRP